jgi:transcriptional regulator with XRE-family HTH domain
MKKHPPIKSKERSIEELFGIALQDFRKEKGFSQEDLGFASGYHRAYISLLERGKKSPSLKTIYQLSEALHIVPSRFMERLEKMITTESRSIRTRSRS